MDGKTALRQFGLAPRIALEQAVALQKQADLPINTVVPEPASLSLLGASLPAFGAWRRRSKAA